VRDNKGFLNTALAVVVVEQCLENVHMVRIELLKRDVDFKKK